MADGENGTFFEAHAVWDPGGSIFFNEGVLLERTVVGVRVPDCETGDSVSFLATLDFRADGFDDPRNVAAEDSKMSGDEDSMQTGEGI